MSLKKETKEHVVSIRLSTTLKEFLIKDSKKKRLSLGINIEKILAEQKNWTVFSREIMLIEFFREIFIELMSSATDKKIRYMGKNTLAGLLKSAIIFEHGKLTLENLFSMYERWMESNQMYSKHIENNDGHTFVFRHNLGCSFSKITFEAWKELTSKMGYEINPIEIGEASMVFDISIYNKS